MEPQPAGVKPARSFARSRIYVLYAWTVGESNLVPFQRIFQGPRFCGAPRSWFITGFFTIEYVMRATHSVDVPLIAANRLGLAAANAPHARVCRLKNIYYICSRLQVVLLSSRLDSISLPRAISASLTT